MPAGAITSDASVSKWGSPRTKGEAPKGSPCLLSAEHEIRVQLRKESGSMFFWLPAEKQKARRFLTKSAGFLEGPVKIDIFEIQKTPGDSSYRPSGHGAFAPYKRFAKGKTLAEAEFISAEHFNLRRVEAAFGRRNPKQKVIRKVPPDKKTS